MLSRRAGKIRWTEAEYERSDIGVWWQRRYLVSCADAVMPVAAQTPNAMGVVFAAANRIACEMEATPEEDE